MKKLLLFLLFITLPYVGFAQLAKFQAMYLYNFTRYIAWPTEYQSGEFVIGVMGYDNDITVELRDIATQRKVSSQDIKVVEFSNAKQIKKCHILFIPKTKMGSYENILAAAKVFNILIVTEESYFPENASINLVYSDKKLRYDVNRPNILAAGLKISDRLIAVSSN